MQKSCAKLFKTFEKKRNDSNEKKLKDAGCLEIEEFKHEFVRISTKSPTHDFFPSKYKFKAKQLTKIITEYFNNIKSYGSFQKMSQVESKKFWLRLSSCKISINQIEKVEGKILKGESEMWKVGFIVEDSTIHAISNVSFKDKVLINKTIEETHFSRFVDNAHKQFGSVFQRCILRDVF